MLDSPESATMAAPPRRAILTDDWLVRAKERVVGLVVVMLIVSAMSRCVSTLKKALFLVPESIVIGTLT